MKKILLIGCGHMGSSLLRSWVSSKKYEISVIDPIKYTKIKKNKFYNKIFMYKSFVQINNFQKFDFIIFAVKPIDLKELLDEIKNIKFKSNSLAISVIAGKKINYFKKKLKYINQFVRVMPNMPALIGEGVNCVVTNNNSNQNIKKNVESLFKYSGRVIFFKNEYEIDMATAVSGSGPGYVFYLIDSMEKAAVKLGFSKKTAKILVFETFIGSIHLLKISKLNAEDLVKTIATKGGTTEAGLKVMKKNKLNNIFTKLLKASYKKAKFQGK